MSDPMAQLRAAASLCAQLKRENADLTEGVEGRDVGFDKTQGSAGGARPLRQGAHAAGGLRPEPAR